MKATCEAKVSKYLYITVRGGAVHGLNYFFNNITQLDNPQLIKLWRPKAEIKDAKAIHIVTAIFKNKSQKKKSGLFEKMFMF